MSQQLEVSAAYNYDMPANHRRDARHDSAIDLPIVDASGVSSPGSWQACKGPCADDFEGLSDGTLAKRRSRSSQRLLAKLANLLARSKFQRRRHGIGAHEQLLSPTQF